MTDETTRGQASTLTVDDTDLNEAIAAMAGGPAPDDRPIEGPGWSAPSKNDQDAAMTSYIEAGVEKAAAPAADSQIMTTSAFRAGIRALLQHLHLDHPENYLPPK